MAAKQSAETFEEALERLGEIVGQLESESVSLERSLELFAEGKRLAEYCQSQLSEAEEKVKTLLKTASGFEERNGLDPGPSGESG